MVLVTSSCMRGLATEMHTRLMYVKRTAGSKPGDAVAISHRLSVGSASASHTPSASVLRFAAPPVPGCRDRPASRRPAVDIVRALFLALGALTGVYLLRW